MMPIWGQAATYNNLTRKKSRTRLADKYGSFNHNGCILLTNTASNFAFTCPTASQQLAFALSCSFKETLPLHWRDASNWPTLPFSALHLIVMVQEKSLICSKLQSASNLGFSNENWFHFLSPVIAHFGLDHVIVTAFCILLSDHGPHITSSTYFTHTAWPGPMQWTM